MMLVITGARGFIGSVLARYAADRGDLVLALDDESRGLNTIRGDNVTYVKHDCSGGIGEVLRTLRIVPDAVVHLAAATGSLDRSLDELRGLNVEMTKRVYHDAVREGARAFLFPVTSLALGVPDSPYVISKEEALRWLLAEDRTRGIAVPLRFFNVAGEYKGRSEFRKNEVHLLPRLVDCYLRSEPLVINGSDYDTIDGTPSRDFVNVVDVARYLLILASRKCAGGAFHQASDGAIWLGTGQTLTVLQVLAIFAQFVGPVKHEFGPRRAFDCAGLTVDTEQQREFARVLGMLTPAWVSIRDEARALGAQAYP